MTFTTLAFAAMLIPAGAGPRPDAPAVLADTFPDDPAASWPHILLDHTRGPDGAAVADPHWCVQALDPADSRWYLLTIRHGTACHVYDRDSLTAPWTLLATDTDCFA